LNNLDGNSSVAVGAAAITGITGSLADVHTARTSAGITTDTDYTVSVTGTNDENDITNLNALAAETSGVITATFANLSPSQGTALTTLNSDLLAITLEGTLGNSNITDVNTVASRTGGVVTATFTGLSVAQANNLSTEATDLIGITFAAGTADASTLNAIDGKTGTTMTANALTDISGSSTEVAAVVAGGSTRGNYTSTLSGTLGGGDVANLDTILADTASVVTATVSGASANTINSALGNGDAADLLTITLDATASTTVDVNQLDGKTAVNIDATAVTEFTGAIANFTTARTATTIDMDTDYIANISDNLDENDITNLNAIAAETGGKVSATLLNLTAAQANTLTTAATDGISMTLEAGVTTADILNSLDGKTDVAVIASNITGITDSLADVHTARTSSGITTNTSYSATLTDAPLDENAATNLNALAAETSGTVTATVSNLTAAQADTFTTLSDDAITFTLEAGTTTADILNSLDGKTSVTIGAQAITGITDSLADIHTARTAAGITTDTDYNATIDAAMTAGDRTNLNALANETTGVVNGTITGLTSAQAATDLANLTGGTDTVAITIDGAVNDENDVANINTTAARTDGVVTAALVNLTAAQANNLTTGAADAITISLEAGTTTATVLNALDGKSTVTVGAQAITAFSGNFADIVTARTAAGITTDTDYDVTVDDALGNANITDLNDLAGETSGTITAGLTSVTAAQADNLTTAATDAITITLDAGTTTATVLNNLDANTKIAVVANAITALVETLLISLQQEQQQELQLIPITMQLSTIHLEMQIFQI